MKYLTGFLLQGLLMAGMLDAFSVNPGVFELDCNSGNKVNLQYELQCTKSTPEFIRVEYANISGTINTDRIELPKQEIRLDPGADPFKLNILVRTPPEDSPENILKISFFDMPKDKGTISITTRISTRAYLRYKDKSKLDCLVENIEFRTVVNRGKTLFYFSMTVKNVGNTYLKPKGTIRLTDVKGEELEIPVNGLDFPVYSCQSRVLDSPIDFLPEPGHYKALLKMDLGMGGSREFKYKLEVTPDHKVLFAEK
jgi:hypothetical protein